MAVIFARLEKRARYIMGFITLLLVLVLGAFQAGWITSTPSYSYKDQAWYVQTSQSGFIVISEYADEMECQRHASVSAVCRPGKVLSEEARAGLNTRS